MSSELAPDAALLATARQALPEAHVVPISTSGKIGGGSDVEAMEGFGVLRAAALAGSRRSSCARSRMRSNEPDRAKWRFEEAFDLLADAVGRVVPVLS